jgi:lipoprotein-anchoring transpeptidase ErfK/SrfK
MSGRCRGRARHIWARRRQGALAVLLTGSTLLSAVGTVALPFSAHAQSEGDWVDPLADPQMTDISANVDQTIADVWTDDAGDDWVEPEPVVAAPVDAAPTYDANGNIIDPATGAPLAIGPDGAPIDADAGLYFDEAGNLIDPATGMAVSYDANGQPVVSQDEQAAAPDGTVDGADAAAAPEEDVPELVTTPWLAPPPSGPPPGYANWAPPSTVYIPETGHSVDGVFLDSWRAWGGASSWGFPLTSELQENGHIVQYYDYGRFEYHPEDPNGVVQFGDLGRQLQPFVLRRVSGSGSSAVNEAALAARAWAPEEAAARVDSETWRFVPETNHSVAGEFKAFWEATGESGYLGNPVSEPYKVDGVTYQVFERGTLKQLSGEPPAMVPIGKMMVERLRLDTTPSAQGNLPVYSEDLFTPPVTTVSGMPVDPNGEKWVQINITLQYLWAYQGDQVLWQGFISTGRAKFETPTGSYHVLSKLPSQTMEGVIGGESYNVPDVPDVMYFTDRGHALHGTYWHNNFGTPMSHGCVNLPMDVADWMYQWAPVGMRVEITP